MASLSSTDIIRCGAADLARRIAARELSSRQACDAFIQRIEAVNPNLNALVWPTFEAARADADRCDDLLRRGEMLGPLHGVPLTVKENCVMAGTPATIGLASRKPQLAEADGILVQRLRQAGAVILGKTNVPQLMIWHECDNPVYGRTDNPWDLNRSPGGSTGGEAALIAAGGSPLGLGNDLGGSIRLPSHFCGIHGIKPTSGRLTRQGVVSNLRGMEAILFQSGPLARQVEDLELALRVLVEGAPPESYQPDCPPVPLPRSADVAVPQLRVAYFEDDGYFRPAPALRRAVREAVETLRAAGATVVEFQPPPVAEAVHLYFGICAADGGRDAARIVDHSPLDWRVQRLFRLAGLPRFARNLLAAAADGLGQKYLAQLLKRSRSASASEYWELTAAAHDYTRRFFQALDAIRCDVVISPPHALPAMQHRKPIDLLAPASYSLLANLLGIPAGVVSLTRVRADEESDRQPSHDGVIQKAREVEAGSTGLPIAVQVAARHWREDVVLAVMKFLEQAFRDRADFPNRSLPIDP